MKKSKKMIILIFISIFVFKNMSFVCADENKEPLSQLSKLKIQEEIELYIKEHKETTAGVSISVFNDKETLYQKNHGYADIENQIAIDENTVFEWGSVTKLLVWVSVLQLWEQGEIELDEDIRTYLPEDFLLETKENEKITMLNLMHHDAGWQDVLVDLFVEDMRNVKGLKETLQKTEPKNIYPVGEFKAYSNWGVALAGYIVEEISRQQFYTYVHENIFKPLEMNNTALLPDLRDNLRVKEKRKEIKGYTNDNKTIKKDYYHIPLYPAGMATGTMEDFERFGKALLNRDETKRLFLKNETYEKLFDPTLYYGDTEFALVSNGLRFIHLGVPVVGHGGNTAAFSSNLLIDLVHKTGIVVMTNQKYEEIYNYEMMPIIFGEFNPISSTGFFPRQENLGGTYQDARTVLKGYMKLYSILTRIKVEEMNNGELKINFPGKSYDAKPFKPGLYDLDGSPLYVSKDKSMILSGGEYYSVDKKHIAIENAFICLAIVALFYAVTMLMAECWVFIWVKIKKKKIKKDFLKKYYLLTLGQLFFTFTNVLMMALKISNYSILESVRPHVYISFVLMISLLAYVVLLLFRLSKINVRKRTKVKYILTAVVSCIVSLNIYYWQLYLLK